MIRAKFICAHAAFTLMEQFEHRQAVEKIQS